MSLIFQWSCPKKILLLCLRYPFEQFCLTNNVVVLILNSKLKLLNWISDRKLEKLESSTWSLHWLFCMLEQNETSEWIGRTGPWAQPAAGQQLKHSGWPFYTISCTICNSWVLGQAACFITRRAWHTRQLLTVLHCMQKPQQTTFSTTCSAILSTWHHLPEFQNMHPYRIAADTDITKHVATTYPALPGPTAVPATCLLSISSKECPGWAGIWYSGERARGPHCPTLWPARAEASLPSWKGGGLLGSMLSM